MDNLGGAFSDMKPAKETESEEWADSDQDQHTHDLNSAGGKDSSITPPQSPSPSVHSQGTEVDVFDGYPFNARFSVDIDGEEDSDFYYKEDEGDSDLDNNEDEEEIDFFSEVPSPSVDSRRSKTPSNPRKPRIPPKSSTMPQSSKPAGKWESPPEVYGVTNEERDGSEGVSPFASGVVDRYRLTGSKSAPSYHGDHAVSETCWASGVGAVHQLPSEKQSRGRTPSSFRKNKLKATPILSSATNTQHTVVHSSLTDWRERNKSRFKDKISGGTSGSRLTKARSRDRGSRSGSISEGHQSPDYDGESKKKVDWYV